MATNKTAIGTKTAAARVSWSPANSKRQMACRALLQIAFTP